VYDIARSQSFLITRVLLILVIPALSIVGLASSVSSQAGVGGVITAEPLFTAGTFNSVTINPGAIPGADIYEVCYFDLADTDINGCVAMNPAGWDVLAADLEDLVEGRIYGCFIRAHYDQSGDTAYSDTVFSTGEALSHDILITNSAPKALGTDDDAAGAQIGTRAHNYPNPFNPKEEDTRIVFESGRSGSLTILIYDLFGHLVYEKTDAEASDLRWGGRNGRGELVASGGYICLLKVGDKIVSRHKIAVIK
jgi:hypothetical protein